MAITPTPSLISTAAPAGANGATASASSGTGSLFATLMQLTAPQAGQGLPASAVTNVSPQKLVQGLDQLLASGTATHEELLNLFAAAGFDPASLQGADGAMSLDQLPGLVGKDVTDAVQQAIDALNALADQAQGPNGWLGASAPMAEAAKDILSTLAERLSDLSANNGAKQTATLGDMIAEQAEKIAATHAKGKSAEASGAAAATSAAEMAKAAPLANRSADDGDAALAQLLSNANAPRANRERLGDAARGGAQNPLATAKAEGQPAADDPLARLAEALGKPAKPSADRPQNADVRPQPIAVPTQGAGQALLLELQRTDGQQPIVIDMATARPSATNAPQPVNAYSSMLPVQAVAVEIAHQARAGNNRFQIRLDPPEMGRIDVRLDLGRDGQVHTHLTVDKAETYEAIQRDPRGLERALQNAGLKLEDGSIQLSLRDSNNFAGREQGQRDQRDFMQQPYAQQQHGAGESDDEAGPVKAWQLRASLGDGRLDLSV